LRASKHWSIGKSAWVRACRNCRAFEERRSTPYVHDRPNPAQIRSGRARREIEALNDARELNRKVVGDP
jgi:hypothetical protein